MLSMILRPVPEWLTPPEGALLRDPLACSAAGARRVRMKRGRRFARGWPKMVSRRVLVVTLTHFVLVKRRTS
jgi:hypothetical protein